MKTSAIQHSTVSIATLAALLTAGLLTTSFAGPGPDYSKDSKQTVTQTVADNPRWYFSIGGGTDFDYGVTDFSNKLFADLGGPALDIRSHSMSDVYDTNFYRIQGELGYVICPNLEIFGMFKYSAADSEPTRGSFLVLPPNGARAEIFDKWGNRDEYGGELGLRYFFLPKEARIRPYISIGGGATFVDSIDIKASLGDGTVLFNGGIYDSSVVGTASVLVGVEVAVARHFFVGVDAGLRYESTLSDNDRDLVAAGFIPVKPINDNASDRLYCPLTVYAKFRF